MERKAKEIERIEKALAAAHRGQAAPSLSQEWRDGVMRRIRRMHAEARQERARPAADPAFRRTLLPFAAAAGIAAIALLAYLLAMPPAMEQDLFAALTLDPSGLIATEELGMQ
jgi:hypothetical protein